MTENTPHRYQVLAEALHISVNKLETEIGAPSSTMQSAVRRGSEVGGEMAKRILKRYPQVSAEWLITGEGSIFKQQQQSQGMEIAEGNTGYGKLTKLTPLTDDEKLALAHSGDWDQVHQMMVNKLASNSMADILTEIYLQMRGAGL